MIASSTLHCYYFPSKPEYLCWYSAWHWYLIHFGFRFSMGACPCTIFTTSVRKWMDSGKLLLFFFLQEMTVQACGAAIMALQKYSHYWHVTFFFYERMQNICTHIAASARFCCTASLPSTHVHHTSITTRQRRGEVSSTASSTHLK